MEPFTSPSHTPLLVRAMLSFSEQFCISTRSWIRGYRPQLLFLLERSWKTRPCCILSALPPAVHSLVALDEDNPQTQHPQTASPGCPVSNIGEKPLMIVCRAKTGSSPPLQNLAQDQPREQGTVTAWPRSRSSYIWWQPQSHQPWKPPGPAQPFCHSAMGLSQIQPYWCTETSECMQGYKQLCVRLGMWHW